MAAVEGHHRVDLALLAGVGVWNIAQNNVSRQAYGRLNALGVAGTMGIGRVLGLGADELGVGPGALRRGSSIGGPIVAVIALTVSAAAANPRLRQLFRDERVEQQGFADLAAEVLFRIPVGTALFEESVFRGLLWGWWARRLGEPHANSLTSVVFGMWHVLPTLKTVHVYRSGRLGSTTSRKSAAVAGSVFLTAVAGMGFGMLRRKTQSVLAPTLVHGAINVASFVAAWLAAGDEHGPVGGSTSAPTT